LSDGIFDLRTVKDLYGKVEYDYFRLKENPDNSYIAFDFFMTAAHIPDWITNGDGGKSKIFRKNEPILRVCYQLACNGKHFRLTSSQHDAVKKTEKECYVAAEYVEEDYVAEPLRITLTDNLADKLGVTNPVSALEFATKVVDFWKNWLQKNTVVT
jgi:hypothetical protein